MLSLALAIVGLVLSVVSLGMVIALAAKYYTDNKNK